MINTEKMLIQALENNYCVPHFNTKNIEWTKYILEECEKQKSPVIIGVSKGVKDYVGGFSVIKSVVENLIKTLKITVPVALHLDHGTTFEICKEAIDAGFTSVMIDASKLELSENIKLTNQVTKYAHARKVTVEAEIGAIGGTEEDINNNIKFTTLEEANYFYESTKINSLAPALGSVHGIYIGEPQLDFDTMGKISKKTMLPLVLHGGSGISDREIKKAIQSGTSKINIDTELQIAWKKGLDEYIKNKPKDYDIRKIFNNCEKEMKNIIAKKIKLFGSNGKSDE